MKLRAAFLAALALGAFAQPTSTPVVIKREGCFAVMSLAFSPDGSEFAQACGFGELLGDSPSAQRLLCLCPLCRLLPGRAVDYRDQES